MSIGSDRDEFARLCKEYLNKMYPEKCVPAFGIFRDIYNGLISGVIPIPEVKHDKSN